MMDEGSSYGMGMEMEMGMGMGMDMGSMEGAMDSGMGESGGMSPGGGLRHMPRTITIFALRMERQPAATDASSGDSSGEGPVSGALATFMLAVSSDDARALPEPRTARLEGMSGEMMGGMGMEMAVEEPLVRLELLAGRNLGTKRQPQIFSASEIKLVADTIRQQLSRDLLVQDLTRHASDAEYLKRTEPVLKQLLADQYETQIARQQFEIDAIAAKVKLLQSELARRQAAKDRVVEIQTGRIVLEA
ncbi:MAG: hypothetical protein KDA47_16970, partial [Planctomycetales bacterium]|nr:hypothetical protein [Planctomycetales bacterium]